MHGLCGVVLWQPPTQPNGEVVGYEIEFSVGGPVIVGEPFYITAEAERMPGRTVRVSSKYHNKYLVICMCSYVTLLISCLTFQEFNF